MNYNKPPQAPKPEDQEQFGKQETLEEEKKRLITVAIRTIKHALWDYEARGGVDVGFFASEEFQKARSHHMQTFKSSVGMSEAVQFIREKLSHYAPLAPTTAPKDEPKPTSNKISKSADEDISKILTPQEEIMFVPKGNEAANDVQFSNDETIAKNNVTSPEAFNTSLPKDPVTAQPQPQINTTEPKIIAPPTPTEPLKENVREATLLKPVQEVMTTTLNEPSPAMPALNTETMEEVISPEKSTHQYEQVSVPENTLESQESIIEYIEGVKNLVDAYSHFFDGLNHYNSTTLDNRGNESTESILYTGDLISIKNELEELNALTSQEDADRAIELIKNVRDFLMNNSFPIKRGMLVSSLESYRILGEISNQLITSLNTIFASLKTKNARQKLGQLLELLNDDAQWLDDFQQRKKSHLENYQSR